MTSDSRAVIDVRAPAKVNLTLRIVGRRADGYHLLDSLVIFAGAADRLRVADADRLSLRVEGPFAGSIADPESNLVVQACRLLAERLERPAAGAFVLDKRLPVAAGLGGGSADAAATLRALLSLWDARIPPADLAALALRLGADVPACLTGRPLRMAGVGEDLAPLPDLPPFGLLLANPRVPLSTAAVFKARRGAFSGPEAPPAFDGLESLLAFLAASGNDLQATAVALCPAVGTVLTAVAALPGCRIARMSGSGPTCFGLFATAAEAKAAAALLTRSHPDWWVDA